MADDHTIIQGCLSYGAANALDAEMAADHERALVEYRRLVRERDEMRRRIHDLDEAETREREEAREALREADRILAWWHSTFEPHTRRAWRYEDCEPCRPIREQVRAALAAAQTEEKL